MPIVDQDRLNVIGLFLCCTFKTATTDQMIGANKAGEEQITKGHHVGSPRHSVCFTVCVCASACKTSPQAPKDDPALFKDELKTAEKLFHLFCCSSPLDLQHWQHHFKHLVFADCCCCFVFVVAEETNWKGCNCNASLRPERL